MSTNELTSAICADTPKDPYLIWKSNQYVCYKSLPGIIAAGGLYPLFLVLLLTVFLVASSGITSPLSYASFAVATCFVGYFVGINVAMITGVVSIFLLNGLNSLLGNLVGVRWIVAASGSLAGYLFPAILMMSFEGAGNAAFFVMGPFLGMMLGFLGAITYLDLHFKERVRRQTELTEPKLQFKITHILLATAITAILISVARFSGNTRVAVLVGFWVVAQPTMAFIFLPVAKFLQPWVVWILRI